MTPYERYLAEAEDDALEHSWPDAWLLATLGLFGWLLVVGAGWVIGWLVASVGRLVSGGGLQ